MSYVGVIGPLLPLVAPKPQLKELPPKKLPPKKTPPKKVLKPAVMLPLLPLVPPKQILVMPNGDEILTAPALAEKSFPFLPVGGLVVGLGLLVLLKK